MKKILASLLFLGVVLSITLAPIGCGEKKEKKETTTTTTTPAKETEKK